MAAVLMEQVRLVRRLLAVAGFLSAERARSWRARSWRARSAGSGGIFKKR